MKDGQTAFMPTPAGLTLVHLAASQTRPLDEAAAKPFIEQYLTNQKRNEIAAAEIKQLLEKAKIEYVGDFAKSDHDSPASPAPQTPAAAAPVAPAVATPVDKALAKGISGLK